MTRRWTHECTGSSRWQASAQRGNPQKTLYTFWATDQSCWMLLILNLWSPFREKTPLCFLLSLQPAWRPKPLRSTSWTMKNPPPPPHSPQLEHTETICFSATSSQKNNPCIQISIHWGQTQRQKNKIKETNSLHKCDSKSLLTWLAFPSSNSHAAVYLVRYSIVKL